MGVLIFLYEFYVIIQLVFEICMYGIDLCENKIIELRFELLKNLYFEFKEINQLEEYNKIYGILFIMFSI